MSSLQLKICTEQLKGMGNFEDRLQSPVMCSFSCSLCISNNAQGPHFDQCWWPYNPCACAHTYTHVNTVKMFCILSLMLISLEDYTFWVQWFPESHSQMSKSVLIFMFQCRSQQSWERIVINMPCCYNALLPLIVFLPASTQVCPAFSLFSSRLPSLPVLRKLFSRFHLIGCWRSSSIIKLHVYFGLCVSLLTFRYEQNTHCHHETVIASLPLKQLKMLS